MGGGFGSSGNAGNGGPGGPGSTGSGNPGNPGNPGGPHGSAGSGDGNGPGSGGASGSGPGFGGGSGPGSGDGPGNGPGPGFNNGPGNNNGPRPGYGYGPGSSSGTGSGPADADDEIDLRKLAATLYRHKWALLLFLILGTAGAWFYAQMQTPIFRGEGSMIIAEDRGRYSMAGSDLSTLLTTSFGIGQTSRVQNELEVIRSRNFIGEIADTLLARPHKPDGRIWPVLWYEYPEDSTIVDRNTVVYRIRANMATDLKDRESDVVQVIYHSPSPQEAQFVVNQILDQYYDFSTRQNRLQARSAITFLDREEEQLRRKLVQSEEHLRDFMNREGLIQLDAQSTRLVNTMAELEAERKSVEVQRVAVNSALESYEAELESIRPGLADQFAAGLSQRLNRYQFQLAEVETEKMLMASRNPQLRENPQLEPAYSRLRDEAGEIRNEIRRITSELVDQDDRFLGFLDNQGGGITTRLADLRQELMALRIEQQQLRAQASVLDERIAAEERFFARIPDNMVELARLQRNMKVNEQLYLTISMQSSELAVWEQTQMGFGRVVDYSILPWQPVSPRTKLLLLVGFVLGGVAGLGYVFIRQLTSTQLNSISRLKEAGYPLMAVIPDTRVQVRKQYQGRSQVDVDGRPVSTNMVTLLDPISPASESYRRLQSNLIYSQPDQPYRVICISSANKSEGKTTVMANLAVTLAESGRRVVVVDCDFRRPQIHREYGLDSAPGVTDYLFGEQSLEGVIQPTVVDGVDVVAAGKRIDNPSGLSRSQKLGELVDTLREKYDFVLVDTAPYGIITDAAPLLSRVDGIILVARFNMTREADLEQTIENLQSIRANIIGTVMMAFDYRSAGDYKAASYYRHAYTSYNRYVDENR